MVYTEPVDDCTGYVEVDNKHDFVFVIAESEVDDRRGLELVVVRVDIDDKCDLAVAPFVTGLESG